MRRIHKSAAALIASLALLLFRGSALPAQQAEPDSPPLPQPSASADAAEDSPAPPRPIAADGIIYIPFHNLPDAFEKPDTEIVLPYAEYLRLLEAWKAAQPTGVKPPPVVLERASYALQAEDELARVTATLSVNVLGPAWSQLPIRFGEAAVGGIASDTDILLRGAGEGQYILLFPKPGKQTLTLDLTLRVKQSVDGREATLDIPSVALSTLEVAVPRAEQLIELAPPAVPLPVDEVPADQTRLKAQLGGVERVAIKWRPRTGEQVEHELFATVSNRTRVSVDEGLAHTDAWLTYDILRGEMSTARIVLPKDDRLLSVSADARVRDWKSDVEGDRQIVTVEFLSPEKKKVVIEIHTERQLAAGEFSVIGLAADGAPSGIHALDVVRESGEVEIRHAPDVALRLVEQLGVVRVATPDVENLPGSAPAFAFRFYSPQATLRFAAGAVEPRLTVAQAADVLVDETELKLTSRLNYAIARAGVFELRLRLPAGLVVDNVESPKLRDFSLEADSRILTVALRERVADSVELTVTGRQPLPADAAAGTSLLIIEPLDVERETGAISLFARDSVEVQSQAEGLSGVQPLPLWERRQLGDAALAAAWTVLRRPAEIRLRLVRKPARLTAAVASTIDLQPQQAAVSSQVDFLVEHAGIDVFRIALPEDVSSRARIELAPNDAGSAPIKQKTAALPEDGAVVWTIVTQRAIVGRQRFLVQFEMPYSAEVQPGRAPDPVTVRLPQPLGNVDATGAATTPLSRVEGETALKKDRTLSVTASAAGGDVEQVDPRELKRLPHEGTLAFRYFRDDRVSLTLTASRNEIQDVVPTVVTRGLVEVVVGADAAATYRCRYQLKTSERQRLLVHLPVHLEVLGAFLNDREVKLEKADADVPTDLLDAAAPYWLNVARPESSDEPLLLTLQFLWRVNPPLGESRFSRGQLSLPLPAIGAGGRRAAQETTVVIWAPEEYVLVGPPENFEQLTKPRTWSFLRGEKPRRDAESFEAWILQGRPPAGSFAQLPTTGRHPFIYSNIGGASQIEVHWWSRLGMTLLFSLTAALVGWVLMRTSWENKLGILLLAAFAAALYGLKDPSGLAQTIEAATPGLVVLVGLWLVHGVSRCLRGSPPAPPFRWDPQHVPYAVIPPPGVFDSPQSPAADRTSP